MIKVTRKNKRKNPTNFYKEIEKLIGKNVIVRVNGSKDFYFSVEGELENKGFFFSVTFRKNPREMAQVHFTDKMITSIKDNFVDVKIEPNSEILEEIRSMGDSRVYINLREIIDKTIILELPSKVKWSFIQGKLKYNKQYNFYYIQDFNHRMQIRLIEDMVFKTTSIFDDNNKIKYSFEILSENITDLWRKLNK